jgi:sterol desaturase/sphingolipid hydroxylase (fatty acid hydroxylase superfamily)
MNIQKLMLFGLIVNLLRYFFIAGIAYFVFYYLYKSSWASKKIQAKYPDTEQVWREIRNSLLSIFIFALVGILIFTLNKLGLTRIYLEISKFGWIYFLFSIAALLFIHDTYFYWSHRALHHPKLIRFHLEHHHSHNTTPFTSFSFHPIEALTQTGFLIIIFFIPIHIYAIAITMLWQMFFNVSGHLGFEIFPKKIHDTAIGKQFNTVTHHNMHHRYTNQNFGLYFNFWDRIMKTNHKEYEKQYTINVNKMYKK